MKFLLVLALFGFGAVLVNCEAPVAPYAPSGWRPSGPAFELPTEEKQPTQEYGSPESKAEVEVTEEELQYAGDIATTESTTSFQEYGAPATSVPDEQTSTFSSSSSSSSEEDDLSVQGLPGTEPAADFRSIKGIEANQRFTSRRNQRFQAQNVQLTRPSSKEQAQFRQQQFFQQNQFQKQQASSFSFQQPQKQFNARFQNQRPAQQFGRLTSQSVVGRQNTKARALPIFEPRFLSQKQVTLDSYGAPAQAYGPPQQEYGPPQQYGPPPTDIPEEEIDSDLPEEEPQQNPQSPEESSEEASDPNDSGSNVAISNAVASGSFEQRARESRRYQNQKSPFRNPAPSRLTNLPANEPVYMYNQFGQLVRIL